MGFFQSVKDLSIKAKDGIVSGTKKAASFSSKNAVIRDRQTLGKTIEKSKDTKFTDKKTGEEKLVKKSVMIMFINEKSDFFQKTLESHPIWATKAFYESVAIRLSISNIKDIDVKQYGIEKFPSIVVFENAKPTKVIYGEKNIEKILKTLKIEDVEKPTEDKKELKDSTSISAMLNNQSAEGHKDCITKDEPKETKVKENQETTETATTSANSKVDEPVNEKKTKENL